MKKFFTLLLFCLLLAGCSSKHIPDWTYAGYNQLEDFKKAYLAGREKIAALHFAKATEEIKKSGDLDVLAQAHLTKYAVQTALLERIDDSVYLKIAAVQSTPENSNYYDFMKGRFDQADTRYLPEQYRNLVDALRRGNKTDITAEGLKINDPLSRLIAVGIIIQYEECDEKLLQNAADTASRNGWKKALLVYLEKLADYYKMKKEAEKEDRVRKRIDLMH